MSSGLAFAVKGKCPCCRKGELFQTGIYSSTFYKTNKRCKECDVMFEVEPGFFIGAMYVNYGFTVTQVLTVGFLVHFLIDKATIYHFISATLLSIFVLLPITFRLSKSLYLYWFSGLKFVGDSRKIT